jgi:hypothetical protein
MRERFEARELPAATGAASTGCAQTPATINAVAAYSVRCPSCDHANPRGANYCNQCGMPVHFEECGRCEAINLRGAPSCHKCGCILPGSATLEPVAVPPAVTAASASQEILPEPDQTVQTHVAGPAPRRRHGVSRVALLTLGLALVAVPTYIATEHPSTLHRVFRAFAPAADLAPKPVDVTPAPAAAAAPEAVPAAPQDASAALSEVAPLTGSNAGAPAGVAPPVTQGARSSATKSKASRAKQGTRKAPARKPASRSS